MSEFQIVAPKDIEKESFRIIGEELARLGKTLPADQEPVTKRVIHTTADFSFADTLEFSPDAVNIGREVIKQGPTIVTDTQMALSGINKKRLAQWGGTVRCFMSDPDVAEEAQARHVTRAAVSMERAAKIEGPVIYAIGNAPTALIELHEQIGRGEAHPAFLIGVPVGFVNVEYSKELFRGCGVPYIINFGRKGGSNVAASIVNALMYGIAD